MANLKNITELPLADSIDGINLIANDNGSAKQVPADAIGKIKSVNGVEPDENGSVNIEIPEGFSGNWNDLKDKPFYIEEKKTLVVEGVSDSGNYNIQAQLEIGKKYTYCIDEIEYTGVCIQDDVDKTVYLYTEDNSSSYAIIYEYGINLNNMYFDLNTSHKIELVDRVIHKLDTKYLPAYYISNTSNSAIGNKEVYDALLAFYNNPALGFPNIVIKSPSNGSLCKVISASWVSNEGGNYTNLKGFRVTYCYMQGSLHSQMIIISPTQQDANSIENQDMA